MKEIALYEAKNSLSALVEEVENTGEEIVITRHGKPAARLAPVAPSTLQAQAEAARRLLELQAREERENLEAAPIPWETVKKWMRDEDDEFE